MTLVRRVLLIVLLLEVGLLLTVVPWSSYWDRNYFTQGTPWLRRALGSNYVRGAVTGLGLINLAAAVADTVALAAAVRLAWTDALRRVRG
ncbi:MAG: hypothetical protein AB7I25_05725 [Vicinamibacterales bacterium]